MINSFIDAQGIEITGNKICSSIREQYKKIYKQQKVQSNKFMKDQMDWLKTTDEQNFSLLQPFSEIELYKTLGLMKADASQGMDGLGPRFYKKFNSLLLPLLTKLFNQFLQCNLICMDFTQAIRILLLKKRSSKKVDNLILISL